MREETRCRHMGYCFRLIARVLLYAPSHRQDNTYHSLCYTSHGALAGTRNSSMGPPHEGSIRRPIAPWANALTTELHLAPSPWSCVSLLYRVWRTYFHSCGRFPVTSRETRAAFLSSRLVVSWSAKSNRRLHHVTSHLQLNRSEKHLV